MYICCQYTIIINGKKQPPVFHHPGVGITTIVDAGSFERYMVARWKKKSAFEQIMYNIKKRFR